MRPECQGFVGPVGRFFFSRFFFSLQLAAAMPSPGTNLDSRLSEPSLFVTLLTEKELAVDYHDVDCSSQAHTPGQEGLDRLDSPWQYW
ncbi:hypothetical protein EI94DRAFT_1729646 [Lactarius quietus]|nr:hypothetical protein EI94DRAFT_1729646 [Lactarius quietus]